MRTLGALFLAVIVVAGCVTLASKDMRLVNEGYDYLEKNDNTNAERCFKEALEVNPNNPYAVLDIGVVYYNTGRTGLAKQCFEKVIQMEAKERAERATDSNYKGKPLIELAKKNLDGITSGGRVTGSGR